MGNLIRSSYEQACITNSQNYKVIDRKTPVYLREKLPPNRRTFLLTVFRNIKCRTNRYSNSFFPDAIASWNNFIAHFELFPTFDCLKDHLIALFRPNAKPIFGLHDPIGLRLLFQLRVSLSPLHSHKKRYNFIDTQSDICHCNQGIEDTSHFLFSCPSYVNERAVLTSTVNEILRKINLNHLQNQLQLYLYGHPFLIYSDNRKILMSTIKYIKETRRFST